MSISRVISLCAVMLICGGCSDVSKKPLTSSDGGLRERVTAFWEEVDTSVLRADSLEQLTVDYLYLVGHLDSVGRAAAWHGLQEQLREHPDRTVVDYLGDPASPLFSPLLLEEYLKSLLTHTVDTAVRMRTEYLLENICKNRIGERIADLRLIAGNETTSLHRLVSEGGTECLVAFYDPACPSCGAVFDWLVSLHHTDGRLRMIAISVAGRAEMADGPWISARVAHDDELDDMFYLPSLPAAYVVTADGVITHRPTPGEGIW